MIEVNLFPGLKRKAARRKSSLKLPSFGRMSDPWTALAIAGWIIGPLIVGWFFFTTQSRSTELTVLVNEAAADSARYQSVIQQNERLQARRDTIAQKLFIIQEIDAGRYVWAHILDEVSRALPEYTWLTAIRQLESGPLPRFRVEGGTGNNFALTRFMDHLEASPFIQGVRLTSTQLVTQDDRLVHAFVLDARFREPPPETIETVPLFPAED